MISAIAFLAFARETTYALRYVPKEGATWAFRAALEIRTSDATGNGTGRLSLKVGTVASDGAYALESTLSEQSVTTGGKTMTIEEPEVAALPRDAAGRLADWAGATFKDSPPDLLVELALSATPPAPVRIGEGWNAAIPVAATWKPARFTLVGPERRWDRDLLRLDVKGPFAVGTAAGTVWLDAATFQLAGADLKGAPLDEKFGPDAFAHAVLKPE